jgi:hypothetical protein
VALQNPPLTDCSERRSLRKTEREDKLSDEEELETAVRFLPLYFSINIDGKQILDVLKRGEKT